MTLKFKEFDMTKLLKYVLCLMLVLMVAGAQAKKKDGGAQKVYVFGFASSFTDSVAYLTEVQVLEGSYVTSQGFLSERTLYSLQLYGYVNEKLGVENPTPALFFDLKPKKINKKYQKVKRLYENNPNVKLVVLTKDDFLFTLETHDEVTITEVSDVPKPTGQGKDDGKKKKNRKDTPQKGDRPEMPGNMPKGGKPEGGRM